MTEMIEPVSAATAESERGSLDELRARINTDDQEVARQLHGLLAKQGRAEGAEQLRKFGLNPDGSISSA
jgi:hypothetical protein